MDNELEEIMKKIYFTPNHPGSFTSPRQVQKVLKKEYGKSVHLNVVSNWLQKQRSYNLHKTRTLNFKRNPIVAHFIDEQWQADLLFLPDLARFNDGVQIVLVCIDVVSRFAWAEPMKNKTGSETARAFQAIISRDPKNRKPKKLQTDAGKEFFNHHFQNLMKKLAINHFSIPSDKKAAIAERFIKTIKQKIYKFLDTDPNRKRYLDVLQDLIKSYNETVHSKIKMAPSDVNAENEGEVLKNLYSKDLWEKKRESPKLLVGDTVRMAGGFSPFIKNYKGRWTEELFEISQIKNASPRPIYKLKDLGGEPILGIFYENEIQKVNKPEDDVWQVEKILKSKVVKNGAKKEKQYFVKWFGFPESFNSWVDESAISSLSNKK